LSFREKIADGFAGLQIVQKTLEGISVDIDRISNNTCIKEIIGSEVPVLVDKLKPDHLPAQLCVSVCNPVTYNPVSQQTPDCLAAAQAFRACAPQFRDYDLSLVVKGHVAEECLLVSQSVCKA